MEKRKVFQFGDLEMICNQCCGISKLKFCDIDYHADYACCPKCGKQLIPDDIYIITPVPSELLTPQEVPY